MTAREWALTIRDVVAFFVIVAAAIAITSIP